MKDSLAKEDRKRLRIIKNREAAQASRAKHLAYVKSLEDNNLLLQNMNAVLMSRIQSLESQSRELSNKFHALEARISQETNGCQNAVSAEFINWDSLFDMKLDSTPTHDLVQLGSKPTQEDVLHSSYLTPIPSPLCIFEKEQISEPAALTSLKQMILFPNSLMSRVTMEMAPTMLIACCSLFRFNLDLAMKRYQCVLRIKYPTCNYLINGSC